jgi:hypothetical protein
MTMTVPSTYRRHFSHERQRPNNTLNLFNLYKCSVFRVLSGSVAPGLLGNVNSPGGTTFYDAESNKRCRDSQGNWLPDGTDATIMAGTGQSIKNVQGITAAIKVYDGGVVSGYLPTPTSCTSGHCLTG